MTDRQSIGRVSTGRRAQARLAGRRHLDIAALSSPSGRTPGRQPANRSSSVRRPGRWRRGKCPPSSPYVGARDHRHPAFSIYRQSLRKSDLCSFQDP